MTAWEFAWGELTSVIVDGNVPLAAKVPLAATVLWGAYIAQGCHG